MQAWPALHDTDALRSRLSAPGTWWRRSKLQLANLLTIALATDTLARSIISSTMLLVSCVYERVWAHTVRVLKG